MAVLHITYKPDRETTNSIDDGFYKIIATYPFRRLSASHWTINTEEPPEAIWQKFKRYIQPNAYFLMLPLDPSWLTPKDRTVLGWIAGRP